MLRKNAALSRVLKGNGFSGCGKTPDYAVL
jgi:hypothetical protein